MKYLLTQMMEDHNSTPRLMQGVRLLSLVLVLLSISFVLKAQDVSGPTTVTVNTDYTFTQNCPFCTVTWSVQNGNGVVVSSSTSSAVIRFTSTGSQAVVMNWAPGENTIYPVTVNGTSGSTVSKSEEYIVKKPGLSTAAAVYSTTSPADVLKTTAYTDGLGRLHQQVSKQLTPGQKDFVSTAQYDAYGRVTQQYLPFESTETNGDMKTNFTTGRNTFYTNQYGSGETHEYAVTEFETSPLNRPTKSMAPGASWAGANRGISYSYRLNNANEEVARWDGTIRLGTFAANQLSVTEITDEHGNKTIQYTDPYGRLILTKVQESSSPSVHHDGWLCTYNVYDDLYRLIKVIPPKAVQKIKSAGWSVSSTVSDELLFHYTYDNRGRMLTKEVPGAEPEEYVYDKTDRPVLMRTDVQAGQSKWSFVMYDGSGRQAMTGTYNGSTSRSSLQSTMDAASFNYFEVSLVNPGGYSLSNGYYYKPMSGLSGFNPEQVMYYDDYSYSSSLSKTFTTAYNSAMNAGTYGETPASSDFTLGLMTGSKTKVLGTSTWEESVYLYDKRSRPIQVRSKNHKGYEDILTYKYDFSGKMLYSYMHHRNTGASGLKEVKSISRYTYDHADRLAQLDICQGCTSPTSGAWQTIGDYAYDALGQLIEKKLGNNKQDVDYAYNIRGWLKGINNPASIGTDYFAMNLKYDDASVTARRNYNGNIGEIEWRSSGDSDLKRYEFTYDKTNRLTSAYYNNLSDNVRDNDYTVNNITYDANGNIKTLRRYGEVMGTEKEIDNLTYTYANSDNSNKLQRVSDDPSQAFTIGDFKDGYTGTTDYTYDDNGNLLRDLNKGMAADITYNRFNLPEVVNFGGGKTITYKYNGAGAKLQKIVNDNGDSRTFDYIGGFVYESNSLQHFAHPEGRVRNDDGTLVYDYVLTDHQGNSRVTFTTQSSPTLVYKATMETETSSTGYDMEAVEEQLFYNMDASRIVSSTANYSTPFDDDCVTCNEGAQTNSSQRIGPAIILDVMPGDLLNLEVYAKSAGGSGTSSITKSTLVNALVNAFVPTGLSSELGTQTQTVFNGTSVYNAMQGGSPWGSNPRAFLNYIVFDQHFNVVTSGHDPVKSTAFHKLSHNNVSISQKGYVYVWVSNENSQNRTVYFDDLKVSHTKSNILQEDHYYPFGMNMHGLSSSASLAKPNAYKYNGGTELTADFGWEMYDTPNRSYDAQLGRFHQVDPLADSQSSFTPYHFGYNDPIYWSDPTGLCPMCEQDPDKANGLYRVGSLAVNNFGRWKYLGNGRWETLEIYKRYPSEEHVNDGSGESILDGGGSGNSWMFSYYSNPLDEKVIRAISADIQKNGFSQFIKYYEMEGFGLDYFFNIANTFDVPRSGWLGTLIDRNKSVSDAFHISEWTHTLIADGTPERNALEHHIGTFLMNQKYGAVAGTAIAQANEIRGLLINDMQARRVMPALEGSTNTAFEWRDVKNNMMGHFMSVFYNLFNKSKVGNKGGN